MQQTIELLVQDQPGALMRVAGVITSKGANISTLHVAPDAERAGFTRIEMTAEIDARLHLRVLNQLRNLVQVLSAEDATPAKGQ